MWKRTHAKLIHLFLFCFKTHAACHYLAKFPSRREKISVMDIELPTTSFGFAYFSTFFRQFKVISDHWTHFFATRSHQTYSGWVYTNLVHAKETPKPSNPIGWEKITNFGHMVVLLSVKRWSDSNVETFVPNLGSLHSIFFLVTNLEFESKVHKGMFWNMNSPQQQGTWVAHSIHRNICKICIIHKPQVPCFQLEFQIYEKLLQMSNLEMRRKSYKRSKWIIKTYSD